MILRKIQILIRPNSHRIHAKVYVADGLARDRAVAVDWRAPDTGHEAWGQEHGAVVHEVSPGGVGAEVDGYNGVVALGAAVGDVGYASAGGGQGWV
jgi:hypothetical protein